jgi:hypothetical protein
MLRIYSLSRGLTVDARTKDAPRLVRSLCDVIFCLRSIVVSPFTDTDKMYLLHM